MFEIEKNIPINNLEKRVSERKIFLESLEIGDSFKCKRKEYQCLKTYEKRIGIKLSSQRIEYSMDSGVYDDYANDIVRVWRIE